MGRLCLIAKGFGVELLESPMAHRLKSLKDVNAILQYNFRVRAQSEGKELVFVQ